LAIENRQLAITNWQLSNETDYLLTIANKTKRETSPIAYVYCQLLIADLKNMA
jgi:hypothetical protein